MMGHPYGFSAQREIFLADRRRCFVRRALWVIGGLYGGLFVAGYLAGHFF